MTQVPYSLATIYGLFARTAKSKSSDYMSKNVTNATLPPLKETLLTYNGIATLYLLKKVPGTFKLTCQHIFDMMSNRGVILSTYSYQSTSIKSFERHRRVSAVKPILKPLWYDAMTLRAILVKVMTVMTMMWTVLVVIHTPFNMDIWMQTLIMIVIVMMNKIMHLFSCVTE